MDSQLNARPLYLQLFDILLARIVTGEWEPGAAIANEIELAKQYSVSVGTMRKALAELEHAKAVIRLKGRGSFVTDQSEEDFDRHYENIFSLNGTRPDTRFTDVQVDRVAADETVRQKLRINSDERVYRCRQVRSVQDTPFEFEEAYVPTAKFPKLNDISAYELHAVAKTHGVLLGHGQERISLQSAPPLASEALALKAGTTVVVFERLILGIDALPVEWRRVWTQLDGYYYLSHIA